MSDIKYLHFNHEIPKTLTREERRQVASRTVAVKSAPAADIVALAQNWAGSSAEFVYQLDVGVTILSLNDKYNRKLGRKFATESMTRVELTVGYIQITKTHIFVNFLPHKGVRLSLRLNKGTGFSTVVGLFVGDQ